MARRFLSRLSLIASLVALVFGVVAVPQTTFGAATMSAVPSASSVVVGSNLTITIRVNTGGDSTNAYEGVLRYPEELFDPVRASTSGSICNIFINSGEPSGGVSSFACGNSTGGYAGSAGTLLTVVLQAKSPGNGSLSMSNCSVLANDGSGTELLAGCAGAAVSVTGSAATPTPTPAAPGAVATPTSTKTPKPSVTPKPSATPNQTAKPAETPVATLEPTPEPAAPSAQPLPADTPAPSVAAVAEGDSEEPAARRSIGQAFQDLFKSVKEFRISTPTRDFSGLIALLLTSMPILGLLFAIVFFSYRLYLLERHRRRSLDRLFEMELAELAALEGKMDLLADKGGKGREEYREEFEKAKERILRELKPDFNKKNPIPKELAEGNAAEPSAAAPAK